MKRFPPLFPARGPVMDPKPDPNILELAKEKNPWRAAGKHELVRYSYKGEGEVIDPGINFFVLALEHLKAVPQFSCEGHPAGFYITFKASYKLAERIASAGFFDVSIDAGRAANWRLSLRNQKISRESDKARILTVAAEAWTKAFLQPEPALA